MEKNWYYIALIIPGLEQIILLCYNCSDKPGRRWYDERISGDFSGIRTDVYSGYYSCAAEDVQQICNELVQHQITARKTGVQQQISERVILMFNGFSQEALDFLMGIRVNNNKEWFEAHKDIYTDRIVQPMKELGEELYAPFKDMDDMMFKVGRIYRDVNFPPYLHYRDVMWIYVRYNAMWWSKTPTLYFELSPEGAEYGFRIAKPDAVIMERFRSQLTEDPKPFLEMIEKLKTDFGVTVGGEEYKRSKKCTVPEAEEYFRKKGLEVCVRSRSTKELFSRKIAENAVELFKALQPLNDYFHEIVQVEELAKALIKEDIPEEPGPEMVKAPTQEFMW